MADNRTCEICGGVLRTRKGDPPYRGSCPTCKEKHERGYKPDDLDQGSDFINTVKDAKETFDGFAFKIFWVLIFVGLVSLTVVGFFPSTEEDSDDEPATGSTSMLFDNPQRRFNDAPLLIGANLRCDDDNFARSFEQNQT